MKKTGLYFSCQMGRLPDDTFEVAEFTLNEGLSSLFTLSLTLVSHQRDIDTGAQLLQHGSLTITLDDEEQRTVTGVIESIEMGNSNFHYTYYYVTVRPHMWVLTLDQDSRIYHKITVSDLLKQILQQKGVTGQGRFLDEHQPREYITMKRESSYAFFSRLAAEEGIAYWFTAQGLYYSDSHLSMTAGLDLVFNPDSKPASELNVISQLRFGSRARPGETLHKDRNYGNPDYALKHKAVPEEGGMRGYTVFESYGRFQKDNVAKPFLRYRIEQLNTESKSGVAHTNCIKLMPGKIFKLTSHPVEAMNDRWQVVTVTHHGVQPIAMMEESAAQGTTFTNQVTFIPGRNDWRPPYHYKPLADGDEVATVVGPKGEEIYVNEDGAVRVHFHWNRYDAANDTASCWVRVAQGWNGNGFGFLATPRIGQEVIISYLNGDIDRPIVTGCTYNGLNRPPLDLPAEKTRTTIKTKTHKGEGFNELRFEDANGSQEVFIHAQRDMRQEIKHQKSTLVGDSQFTHIKKDKHLRIEGEVRDEIFKDYSLMVHQDAQLRMKKKFLLDSMEEVHLQSRQKMVLDAAEEIVLKVGGSFISITAAGIQATPSLNVGAATPKLGTPANPRLPIPLTAGINKEPGVSQPVPQQIYRPVRFGFSS
jgi:type VI secretion system secreted protein VgrG